MSEQVQFFIIHPLCDTSLNQNQVECLSRLKKHATRFQVNFSQVSRVILFLTWLTFTPVESPLFTFTAIHEDAETNLTA